MQFVATDKAAQFMIYLESFIHDDKAITAAGAFFLEKKHRDTG